MSTNKTLLAKGIKYEAIALPLIIAAPILITIGFKALKDDNFVWLILGGIFGIVGVSLGFKGILIIVSAFFDTEK